MRFQALALVALAGCAGPSVEIGQCFAYGANASCCLVHSRSCTVQVCSPNDDPEDLTEVALTCVDVEAPPSAGAYDIEHGGKRS